jgi:cholinesterase
LVPQDGSPPLPYFFGRYSNAPVAVERLAEKLGVPLHDFAVGGALSGLTNEDPRLPQTGVLAQVQAFVAAKRRLDADALNVVWGGANDFLGASDLNPSAAIKITRDAVSNLSQSLIALYRRGARHFLVPNLPDLGLAPLERSQSSEATGVSVLFNRALGLALHALSNSLRESDIRTFDTAALLQTVVDSPGAYGFANVNDACVGDSTYVCILDSFNGGDAAGYLFWDAVHPSSKAHALLADQFFETVAARGVETPTKHPSGKDWLNWVREKHRFR